VLKIARIDGASRYLARHAAGLALSMGATAAEKNTGAMPSVAASVSFAAAGAGAWATSHRLNYIASTSLR